MPYDVLSPDDEAPLGRRGAGGEVVQQVTREPRLSDKVAEHDAQDRSCRRRLEVGDRLPSERELGEQFGVSRTVVREPSVRSSPRA